MRSNIFLNGYFIILETIFCLLQQKQSTWFEDRNDEWDIYIYIVNQECATTKVRQLSSVTTFLVLLLATRWCQTDKFSTKEFAITTHFYNYVQTTPIHDVAGQIIFCSFLFLFFFLKIFLDVIFLVCISNF